MNERDRSGSAGTPTHASHAGSHSGEARPLRGRRLVLSVGGAHGELVTSGGRWVLDNDSEVRVLEALLGASGTRARFWALAATLNAGLVEPQGVLRLNRLLSQIAAGLQPGEVCVVEVPDEMLGAVAYSCASQQDHNLTRWLAWALSARLDANLVRGPMAGPGWESLYVPGRLHLRGFNRDTHWMSEMPKPFWDRLGTHRHQRLRAAAAASDPAAQPEVLDRLARDPNVFPESWDLAACHPRTPVETLRDLARPDDLPHALAWRVAQNRCAPPQLLENPHTPPDALKALAGDECWTPRAGAGENPATAAALLAVLAADENFNVRFFAAKNPATPLESLRALADDDRWEVRAGVALNAAAPPVILEALAADRNKEVRRYICENASTSQNLLDVLCGDRKYVVRAAAARALQRRGQQPRRPNTAAAARDRSIRTRQQYDTKNGERR